MSELDDVYLWMFVEMTDCCVDQAQYGYIVVQMLMNHLDENSRKEAQIKVSIIDVLSVTVLIAAGGSIGACFFVIFVTHLTSSLELCLQLMNIFTLCLKKALPTFSTVT